MYVPVTSCTFNGNRRCWCWGCDADSVRLGQTCTGVSPSAYPYQRTLSSPCLSSLIFCSLPPFSLFLFPLYFPHFHTSPFLPSSYSSHLRWRALRLCCPTRECSILQVHRLYTKHTQPHVIPRTLNPDTHTSYPELHALTATSQHSPHAHKIIRPHPLLLSPFSTHSLHLSTCIHTLSTIDTQIHTPTLTASSKHPGHQNIHYCSTTKRASRAPSKRHPSPLLFLSHTDVNVCSWSFLCLKLNIFLSSPSVFPDMKLLHCVLSPPPPPSPLPAVFCGWVVRCVEAWRGRTCESWVGKWMLKPLNIN